MSLIYIFAFLFFGAAGIFYLAVLVMFQDAIDYGEVKNGERKESICFAWRPLDVKLASGLNRGLQYLVYFATGTMSAINAISDYEGKFNAGEITEAEMQTAIQGELDAVSRNSKIWFGVIVIGVILLVFALGFFFLRFKYSLDEAKVKEINAQLNQKAVNQEEDLVLETADGALVEDEIPDSPGEED